MSFELVRQLQDKAVAVAQVCCLLAVSRSGYCAARRRSKVVPAVCEASVQLKASFAASGGAYGSRRLSTAVASRGAVMGLGSVSLAPIDAPAQAWLDLEAQVCPHDGQPTRAADLAKWA